MKRQKQNFFWWNKDYKNAKITELSHAYRGYASTYNVKVFNFFDPERQLKDTESAIRNKLKDILPEVKGFKFMMALVLEFKKIESDDETKYSMFYLLWRAETIINESDIDGLLESIYRNIISNIQKSIEEGFGWIIVSIVDHTINISNWKPSKGSRYIKLAKEFNHPKKALINIQDAHDNECF